MSNQSAPFDPDPKVRYKYQPITGATWTNTSSFFAVMIGFDAEGGFTTAGDVMTVISASITVDSIELEAFGTAANTILLTLPHKILIPPNAIVTMPHSANAQVVICRTLEDAMAII